MATTFTQEQKRQIRHYLGYSRLRSQNNPTLEGAITSAEQLAVSEDGGALVDWVASTLVDLVAIDQKMKDNWDSFLAQEAVGDVKINSVRANAGMRMEGRRLVTALSVALDTPVQLDVYSSSAVHPGDATYSNMLGR